MTHVRIAKDELWLPPYFEVAAKKKKNQWGGPASEEKKRVAVGARFRNQPYKSRLAPALNS